MHGFGPPVSYFYFLGEEVSRRVGGFMGGKIKINKKGQKCQNLGAKLSKHRGKGVYT